MFRSQLRTELQSISSTLGQCRNQVPGHARAYHAVIDDLQRQADALQSPWRLYASNAVVGRLRQSAERLADMAGALGQLIGTQVPDLADRIASWTQDSKDETDRDFRDWIRRQEERWSGQLGRLGRGVQRAAELNHDQVTAQRLECELARYQEALDLLRQAPRILRDQPADAATGTLQANLPELRRRLVAKGPTETWLEEIRELVGPLHSPSSEPPAEFRNLDEHFTEMRSWNRYLEQSEAETERLWDRYGVAEEEWQSWSGSEIEALCRQVGELRASLRETAQDMRKKELKALQTVVRNLSVVATENPELEQHLELLQSRRIDRPQDHNAWMQELAQAKQRFTAIAATQQGALVDRLENRLTELRANLRELELRPLSPQQSSEVDGLKRRIEGSGQVVEAEQVLEELRLADQIATEIKELGQRIEREQAALTSRQQSLLQRNATLGRQARRSDLTVPDLQEQIEALGPDSAGQTLQTANDHAVRLEKRLQTNTQEYVVACGKIVTGTDKKSQGIVSALHAIGQPSDPEPDHVGELSANADSEQATQAVTDQRQRLERLEAELGRAERALLKQREDDLARLSSLTTDGMGPEAQRQLRDLVGQLTGQAWASSEDPTQRIQALHPLLAQVGRLFVGLMREEKMTRSRLDTLRQRLQAFRQNDFRRYHPEVTDRIEDLLYGLPEEPWDCQAVGKQLDKAHDILSQLEDQARRLAAAELDRTVAEMKQLLKTPKEGEFATVGQQLLSSVEACGHENLAPAGLRSQLLDHLAEIKWETTGDSP